MLRSVFVIASITCLGSAGNSQATETTVIPLSSIVTTSPQEGMLHTKEAFSQKDGDHNSKSTNGYLRQILQASRSGASNLFLVDAVNAHAAIAASSSVLVGSRSADKAVPVNTPDPLRGSHWLVVYLGSGPSSPAWWKVEETKIKGNRIITLSYRKAPPSPATADVNPYYYWVPLGKLSSGTYEVKLFDTDHQAITLMRRVEVLP